MKKYYYLAVLALLTVNCMVLAAFCEEQSALTIYVHEGNLTGNMLPGVKVSGQDAAGNNFEGQTNSKGSVVILGQPGTWQFNFAKEGYETVTLRYGVNKTDEAAAYLQKTNPSQDQVSLTIYVHEGNLTGNMLPGVKVSGQDATGNNFEGQTDSEGSAVIRGQPGTWQFIFAKEGYETVNLRYDVNKTDDAAAYLQKTNQS